MSENFMKHFISFVGTMACLMAYLGGYFAGKESWWWTAIGLVAVYFIILKLIDA